MTKTQYCTLIYFIKFDFCTFSTKFSKKIQGVSIISKNLVFEILKKRVEI